MHYEGPIYRPPSEADSLLIQATVGCPHNRCIFCMVYKNGPRFKVRKMDAIKADLREARALYGPDLPTLFFPAGNTIAMKTDDLAAICQYARELFPGLERITVYGSAQYIHQKGPADLKKLAQAGLSRIHVGLESGDDTILRQMRKGTDSQEQIEAGEWVMAAGMELSLYVILGLGGKARTRAHALETARVLNRIEPDFIRLRTLVPKIHTPLLNQIQTGEFELLGPHAVLRETAELIGNLAVNSQLLSDHYSNYLNLSGKLPYQSKRLLDAIQAALSRPESDFRPFFIGTQ